MDYKSKYLNASNGRIYYETSPGKPTITFIPGAWVNMTSLNRIRQFFAEKGYGTMAMDLRGHGKSSYIKYPGDFSLNNCCNDLENIIDKEKIKKPILVGYSAGGMVAQQYA